ncbi:MAG TPA: hypothetical protein VG960_02855 [Caulobacteraceae bacterium]|nr:hypothetical protein [Caulobacteraceae bacterium]
MAKAVLSSSTPVQTLHRPRTSTALAVLAFTFLAVVGALGIDWREGPAMVFGEVMGIAAPVALIALAGLIIYRICNRSAAS